MPKEIFANDPAFMTSRDAHMQHRGQSNTDPQNPSEKGTREDDRKSIPEVFIPVRDSSSSPVLRIGVLGRIARELERVKRS